MKDNTRKGYTRADHIHQHDNRDDTQYDPENPVDGEELRAIKAVAANASANVPDARRMGATIDTKPMSLSPTSDEAITNFKQSALDQFLRAERDRACGFPPLMHDEPRPGHHHHTFTFSRDDERKNRAAMLSREINTGNSDREALRHRCHAIINSWEHMESDKEIALLALEQLAQKAKL